MAKEPLQGGSLAPATGNGLAGIRMAGVRPCPSCNASINVHATVCPNCGEHVAVKEKSVRCRRCRRHASSNLVVCPHCGRELHPATTRWLTWGVPLLALLLVSSLVFVRLSRGDPGQWVQAQGERVARLAESLSSRLQPEFSVAMIPPGQDPDDPLVSQAIQSGAEAGAAVTLDNPSDVLQVAAKPEAAAPPAEGDPATAAAAAKEPAATPPANEVAQVPAVIAETATATTAAATSTATLAAAPTAPAPTATAPAPTATAPTATATAAATATATAVPSPTIAAARALTATLPLTTSAGSAALVATATPSQTVSLLGLLTPTPVTAPSPAALAVYQVQRGDTLFDIASTYDMTVDDLLAANNLTEEDVYTIQPGDDLVIPAPTPEGAPTATPGPEPATYTVRAGDTIAEIAQGLALPMEELLDANGLTINEARTLQPGDVLQLPGAEPTAAPAASVTPAPSATPAATASPTTAATPTVAVAPALTPTAEISPRVVAPQLRSPESGAAVSCSGQGTLNWSAVPNMRPTDLYLVHLGYVNSIGDDDAEEIIWVMTQQRPASTTSWQLDSDLCGLAPVTEGKQWRWYVEVAEKSADGLQPVSPASAMWGFAWQ